MFLLAVALAVLAGTAAQSVTGFGFALLVVPVLTVVAGPQTAVVVMLPPGRRTELTAGALSGALATSVGTNGPPLVVAFQATGMPPGPFRATLAAAFAVQGSVALATFWAAGLVNADVGRAWLVGIPAAVVGALAGDRVFARMDRSRFRGGVLLMLAASGTLALASAVRG